MRSYQELYLAIMIEDHETSTYELFSRLADGKGLECRIVTEWGEARDLPSKIMENRLRLVFYGIKFDQHKTEFIVSGYLFGDLPVGLKPGKYQLRFNRFLVCHDLPEDLFESSGEVVLSAGELLGANTI